MFKFWGSQEQQAQSHPQEVSSQPWYPSPGISSPHSSHPATPSSSSSGNLNFERPADRLHSPSNVSPSEPESIINVLKNKSVDELRKLLMDKDAYHQFLHSLVQVKTQSNVKDELQKETELLARENIENEPRIMELRNQCRIIRTTELAAAQEKLNELERQKQEALKFYSPASLIQRLQEAMNKTEEESETLHRQLLDKEIDLAAFLSKYKKLRTTYHRQSLLLSVRMSSNG